MTQVSLFSDNDWASGAVFSPDRVHRYLLWRRWAEGAPLLWIMLNPSTADAHDLDPTLRRCIDYAKRWGFPAIEVANLYAFMSPEPAALRHASDPKGEANLRYLDEAIARSAKVILGWGHHAKKVDIPPVLEILQRHGRTPYCLGVTNAGAPLHPLYLKKDLQPVIWKAA